MKATAASAIEVRLLAEGDEAVLERVADEVFDDPVQPAATRAFLADPRHHLAVALDDGLVVGFASAVHYLHPDEARPELWINEVGVAASHRGQGIGGRLLACLLAAARELGCDEAWVLTEADNLVARRLYLSEGGREAPAPPLMYTFRLE